MRIALLAGGRVLQVVMLFVGAVCLAGEPRGSCPDPELFNTEHDSEGGVTTLLSVCADPCCDFQTISAAMESASDRDTILVVADLHLEEGITISKNVTVRGLGADVTVVGSPPPEDQHPVFTVEANVTATIRDMTIRGVYSDGGIRNHGHLNVHNAVVKWHFVTSGYGGGVYNDGTLTVSDTSIRFNLADNMGGWGRGAGIFNTGSLTVLDSIVENNWAWWEGGGIYSKGSLVVERSVIASNWALSGDGGGIWAASGAEEPGRLVVKDSVIRANTAGWSGSHSAEQGGEWCPVPVYYGGGVYVEDLEDVVVSGTTIAENVAGYGPAVYGAGGLSLVNTTISGNRRVGWGGGCAVNPAPGTVVSSTVVANSSCGFHVGSGTELMNSIVSVNCGSWSRMSQGFNIFAGGWGCESIMLPTDQWVDPAELFTAVLGPLGDNGGPTPTHALLEGSPAIDAVFGPCPPVDQRGHLRPRDGDGDTVALCDVGAYEAEAIQ